MTQLKPRPIREILRAKVEHGQDCTADESAEIKAFFDRYDMNAPGSLASRVARAFPLETDEWQEDVEKGLRALGSPLDPGRGVDVGEPADDRCGAGLY